jgi:predicted lipoprotein with Yx(FWY)xxD motif
MHYVKTLAVAIGVVVAAAAFAVSASGSASNGTVVKIGSSNLGRILVDSHGKTLYLWAHDKGRKSTCYGDCASYWPPLIAHGKPLARAGARARLVGTTRRSDGRLQVTYAGHPLYYFVSDRKPGQTTGQGLNQFGGPWWVLSPAGKEIHRV